MKFKIFNINIEISSNQIKKTTKASQARENQAKEKIINAVNALKNDNKKITEYAISKQSKCSINTIKKYRDIIKELVCTDTK